MRRESEGAVSYGISCAARRVDMRAGLTFVPQVNTLPGFASQQLLNLNRNPVNFRSSLHWPCAALLAILLAGCGGGGGGDSGGGSGATPPPTAPQPTPSAGPALQFSPATVTSTIEAGQSATISVNATVLRPNDFTGNVFALVQDDTGVLLPGASIMASSPTQYTVLLQSAPNLALGAHKGTFSVKLCRDTACSAQYPGSPMALPYEFTVVAARADTLSARPETTLDVTSYLGDGKRHQEVLVIGDNLQWTASSNVGWAVPKNFALSGPATGAGTKRFIVEFDPAGLAPGKYQGVVTIVSADKQQATLPVSLQVMQNAFQLTSSGVYRFSGVNGAPLPTQNVNFSLTNGGSAPYTLSSDRPWLTASPASGNTPGSATFAVDPAVGQLASGNHSATVTFKSPAANDLALPVELSLAKATLSASTPTITLGGSNGREFAPAPLTLSLNTRQNAWPWSVANVPAWAQLSATAGSLSEAGTVLTVTPAPASAPIGSTSVMLAPTARVNGDQVSGAVTLTINRDQRKILPSTTGVALVSTPSWSRLRATLAVSDNFKGGAGWSASSDRAWLSVARSGDALSLQADAAALPSDAVSYATVTLQALDAGVSAPETVRVALWKGSTTPTAINRLALSYQNIVADPIRPLVYAHAGAGVIDVYNVYTAQRSARVNIGTRLGDMAVTQNGARLYAYDNGQRIVALDLDTLQPLAALALADTVQGDARLLSVRPNGVELLLSADGVYRIADGKRVHEGRFGMPDMAASADGKRIFQQDRGYSPSSGHMLDVDYSAMGGGTLLLASRPMSGGGSNGRDVASNADGSRVYFANGAPYRCTVRDPDGGMSDMLAGGDAYPNNVEVDVFGRAYCGISGWYSEADVWIHAADGKLLKSFKFAGYARALLDRQMVVSGDGMILVGLTDDPVMAIVPVGPQ